MPRAVPAVQLHLDGEDGTGVGTGRSYVVASGVFAAGCHTVGLRVTYWFGREQRARVQEADAGFCVAG